MGMLRFRSSPCDERIYLISSDNFLFRVWIHGRLWSLVLQITRSAASAVAFGMGLFSGQGTLGGGKHRAFSVISESNATDFQLRFHDNCETYKVL